MSFESLNEDFEERVGEVNAFFEVVSMADSAETSESGPIFPHSASAILKGTMYLVLYNLVEAFVRRGFQEVFEAMKNEGVSGSQLSVAIRKQWVAQRNRIVKTFDGSPGKYMEIAEQIIDDVVSSKVVEMQCRLLPFSGNLDADAIRDVCKRYGVPHTTSIAAKGGVSLGAVKVHRNALSHGDESFAERGRHTTPDDLRSIKNEVIQFLKDILANLREYASARAYLVTP